ncbi:peptide-methionine (R)-S-oxide reductase MsrB [Spirosoma sp. 209]|uniref:peptide-methionine (R)-S-oxide reductase MsrB n=1 Tax=Spirosoma sp. 209 TaxID=1955701 RepID=UPI00098D29A5|nr:peptide-methionine (R)-S-oxide reductase MsrB [Spirosoma sp. 209]
MKQTQLFLLLAVLVAGGLWLYATYFGTPRPPHRRPAGATSPGNRRVEKSDADWSQILTAAQYRVMRDRGTEWPNSSPLNHEHRPGTFACAGCRNPLFASTAKFESGTGWPSFFAPILSNAVYTEPDGNRSEVRCAVCDAHLGHVFPDGPAPTGLRYCMNGVALTFIPAAR